MPPETRYRARIRALSVLSSVGWPGDEPDDGADPQIFDARDMRQEIDDAFASQSSYTQAPGRCEGPERHHRTTRRTLPYPAASSSPPALNSRTRRSARRMGAYSFSHVLEADIRDAEVSAAENLKASAYVGFRAQERPASTTTKRFPMGKGEAARVYDTDGRLVLYRAWCSKGPVWSFINDILMRVADMLRDIKPTFTNGIRGDFAAYFFSLHRGSQSDPIMSAYYRKHQQLAERIIQILGPVQSIVEGIFKATAPRLYNRYCSTIDYVQEKRPGTRACFYPWASFAFNLGTVVSRRHKDLLNLLFGWCLIIPFNLFNYKTSCRLVVEELDCEFEIGAGIPMFVPSAMYPHYNTVLRGKGVRESFVAWTGGPLFQWVDLGGRSISSLSASQKKGYLASMPHRIAEGLSLFPHISEL